MQLSPAQTIMDETLVKHSQIRRYDPAWIDTEIGEDDYCVDMPWDAGTVPWLCNLHSQLHTISYVCPYSSDDPWLKQLSRDIVTCWRRRADKLDLHVDGAGFADIRQLGILFKVEPDVIIDLARIAEKPRLQIFDAIREDALPHSIKVVGALPPYCSLPSSFQC